MQPYDLSPELIGWVDHHKKEIRNQLQTKPLKLERGKEQFMKRIIKAPHFLSEAWSELIHCFPPLRLSELIAGSTKTDFNKSPETSSVASYSRAAPLRNARATSD
jgi:hypothetical protein